MKELKLRNENNEVNYIEDIINYSFVGINAFEENILITKKEDGRFIGLSKKYPNIDKKWTNGTKLGYVLEFLKNNEGKVYLFKSESELIEWFLK